MHLNQTKFYLNFHNYFPTANVPKVMLILCTAQPIRAQLKLPIYKNTFALPL